MHRLSGDFFISIEPGSLYIYAIYWDIINKWNNIFCAVEMCFLIFNAKKTKKSFHSIYDYIKIMSQPTKQQQTKKKELKWQIKTMHKNLILIFFLFFLLAQWYIGFSSFRFMFVVFFSFAIFWYWFFNYEKKYRNN